MPAARRRPCSIATPRIARASTPKPNSPASSAGCTPMATPASAASTRSKLPDPGRLSASPACVRDRLLGHARRSFFDACKSNGSAIAKEALDRIGALFDIERLIAGSPAERRRSVRQHMAKPRIDELGVWLDAQLQKIPAKSDLAGAIRYARRRWDALCRYLDDGRLELSSNAVDQACGIGKKLCAGSDYAQFLHCLCQIARGSARV